MEPSADRKEKEEIKQRYQVRRVTLTEKDSLEISSPSYRVQGQVPDIVWNAPAALDIDRGVLSVDLFFCVA